jgi:hypothetical protein
VEQLVDSLRKGFITNQDILDRIGQVGQSKKKALLESLKEYVNPDVVQSRLDTARAAGAQAQLSAQQAQAQQGLVEQQTALAKTNLAAQQATAVYGPGGLDTYQQFGHFFGEAMPPNPGPEDFKKAAARGNEMRGQLSLSDSWLKALTPVGERTVEENGRKYTAKVNWQGQNVTPPDVESGYPGSPAYWSYAKQLDKVLPQFHPARGQYFLDPSAVSGAKDMHAGSGLVSPAGTPNPQASNPADRAGLANQLEQEGAENGPALVSSMPDAQVQEMMNRRSVAVAQHTPGEAPMVAPKSAPAAPAAKPTPGILTYTPEAWKVKNDIQTAARADKRVTNWEAAQQYITPFVSRAQEVAKMPIEQQQSSNMAVIDQGMVENLIKMYDPSGVMREFKWEKTEQNQSKIERYLNMKNVWQKIKGETVLTPQARQRLVDMGYEAIRGVESAAQPAFQNAVQSAGTAGIGNPLDAEQSRVANGQFLENPWPLSKGSAKGLVSAPGAAAAGPVRFIQGIGNVQRGPDGKFYKVD